MVLAAVIWFAACKANTLKPGDAAGGAFRNMGVDEFEQLVADKEKVVVLDVRTEGEYREGHLEDALLIDVKKDSFREDARRRLPAGRVIAVYCRSGRRSVTASDILSEEGFDVVNLLGGYMAWKDAGKKTVR